MLLSCPNCGWLNENPADADVAFAGPDIGAGFRRRVDREIAVWWPAQIYFCAASVIFTLVVGLWAHLPVSLIAVLVVLAVIPWRYLVFAAIHAGMRPAQIAASTRDQPRIADPAVADSGAGFMDSFNEWCDEHMYMSSLVIAIVGGFWIWNRLGQGDSESFDFYRALGLCFAGVTLFIGRLGVSVIARVR